MTMNGQTDGPVFIPATVVGNQAGLSGWFKQNVAGHLLTFIDTGREEDGRWLAEIKDLPGVMAYGKTEEEAINAVCAIASELRKP